MRISQFFTLAELTKSQAAARRGWDNQPDEKALNALILLCGNVLDPLRAHIARPIVVNSGFRSLSVNRAIGGAGTSQHVKGEAADIEVPGMSNKWLAQTIIDRKLPFDQLILEAFDPAVPGSGWVHVSHRPDGKQRGQILTATPRKGAPGMDYQEGLAA